MHRSQHRLQATSETSKTLDYNKFSEVLQTNDILQKLER
jgi:hypothetical protein